MAGLCIHEQTASSDKDKDDDDDDDSHDDVGLENCSLQEFILHLTRSTGLKRHKYDGNHAFVCCVAVGNCRFSSKGNQRPPSVQCVIRGLGQ